MNNFDDIIKKACKREIEENLDYENMIKKAINSNNYKMPFLNKVAVLILSLVMSGTVVLATTYVVYEKIWKEPEKISEEEMELEVQKVKEPITEEEKKSLIKEEQAIQIANDILKKIGYEEAIIEETNIIRGYDSKKHYLLKGEGVTINLNPDTGAFEYFSNDSMENKKIKCDDISEEEARKIAEEIYIKLNVISENDGYEIMTAEKINMASGNVVNDMWQVSYARKDGDFFDKDTRFTTCFYVQNGKPIYYIIKGKVENNIENNPIVLSKEEAIKIAVEKEKEFSNLEIIETTAENEIKKSNIFIYALENNITNENGEYKIEEVTRNVWVVQIKHIKENKPRSSELEIVKEMYDKKYYIDATTGEIIGGEQAEY